MTRFNPNAISTVGNEWRSWYYGNDRPGPVAALVLSTMSETINSILLPYVSTGAVSSFGKVWCDIYDAANLGAGEAPVTYTFLPNEDLTVYSMYYQPIAGVLTGPVNNTASSLYQYINDLTNEGADYLPNLDDTDFVYVDGGWHRFALDTASLPAGRVLSIQVEIRYNSRAFSSGSCGVDLCRGANAVQRLTTLNVSQVLGQSVGPQMSTVLTPELFINPATQEPWTRADVLSFDAGGSSDLSIMLTGSGGTGPVRVMAVRLKVKTISEKRVAMGANTAVVSVPAGVNTTDPCVLKTPAGADNWAKAASTGYLVVMRRIDIPTMPSQTQYFARVDSGEVNPDNQGHGYTVALGQDGRLLTATGPETSAYAVIIAKTTGALSVDTQPYWGLVASRLYSGVKANQRISNHGSTSYQTVRAVIGRYVSVAPNANLTVQVKRVSDNVVMGGTATLTPAQVFEHPLRGSYLTINWYAVQIDLSSVATLVAGTAYYVEVASAADQASPWFIYALDETAGHVFTDDQSFGGTTDYALVNGAAQLEMDLALTLTVPPPAGPASITLSTVSYALPDNGGAMCPAGTHEAARVTWAATAEGVLFDHYEVQRSEDGGGAWAVIKRVSDEGVVTFDDVTAARNVALKYRVRAVRTNGLASSWRTQANTTTLPVNSESVIFATNYDPTLTAGFVWLNPQHRYEFLNDREVNVVQMHGRDYSVVYRGTEDRGVLFTLDLLIYTRDDETDCGGLPPSGKGDEAFGALRAIANSDGPSVAVFTPLGKRIFGAMRVPAGNHFEEAALYTATVTVVQTSAVDGVTDL